MKYLFIIYLISFGWINPLLLLLLLAMQMAWLIFFLGWKTSTNCKWINYIWINPLIITISLVNDMYNMKSLPLRFRFVTVKSRLVYYLNFILLCDLFTLTAVELNVFSTLCNLILGFFLTFKRRRKNEHRYSLMIFFRHSIYVMIKSRITLNHEQSFMLQPLMVFI